MGQADRPTHPLVYGYICVEEPNEGQIAVWRKDIATFCATSGYRLGQVFVDRGTPASTFARSGFVELLAALRRPEAHAAVVPTLTHLSTDEVVREALTRLVQQTNSRLLVATLVNGLISDVEAGTDTGAGP